MERKMHLGRTNQIDDAESIQHEETVGGGFAVRVHIEPNDGLLDCHRHRQPQCTGVQLVGDSQDCGCRELFGERGGEGESPPSSVNSLGVGR
jgi:hypothetical protein